MDKRWYHSKKCLMFLTTLASLVVLALLDKDKDVLSSLGSAVAMGLPVLLGMQGWVDKTHVDRSKAVVVAANVVTVSSTKEEGEEK